MEDIKIDCKLVFIIILISIIGGVILWIGYDYYISLTDGQDDEIKYFEGDMTSEIESIDNNISDNANDKLNLEGLIDTTFRLNNNNPQNAPNGWSQRKIQYSGTGHTVEYYVPKDWIEHTIMEGNDGVDLQRHLFEMKDLTNETSYEEFIDKFMEKMDAKYFRTYEKDYATKELNIKGEKFYIIEDKRYLVTDLHFCLAKDGYTFCLTATISNNAYKDQIDVVNKIFSTFTVY